MLETPSIPATAFKPSFEHRQTPEVNIRAALVQRLLHDRRQACLSDNAFGRKAAVTRQSEQTVTPFFDQPGGDWNIEALLRTLSNSRADAVADDLAENAFQFVAVKAHAKTQRSGVFPKTVVEEGRAGFDGVIHGRAIDFRKELAGEFGFGVEGQQLGKQIAGRIEGQGKVALGEGTVA